MGQKTRDQLLSAASDLMRIRNSIDISIVDIGERAKANSSLVGYYFGNKEGLMVALLERDLSGGIAEFQKLLASSIKPAQKLRIHVAGMINLYHRYPYIDKLLLYYVENSSGEESRRIAETFISPVVSGITKLLDEGRAAGVFRKVDAMMFYYSIIGLTQRFFSGRYTLKMLFDIDQVDDALKRRFTDHTVQLVLNGVLLEPLKASLQD